MKPIRPVEVEFTRSGWRQFAGLHLCPGARFVLGVMLRYEVAAYIAAHEEQGIALDTICQEIHYDSGLYMLLMKCQGVWYGPAPENCTKRRVSPDGTIEAKERGA